MHSIENLKWKLEKFCEGLTVIATFTDPVDGVAFLQSNTIDLLFIDIEMPKLNGFDVLRKIENPGFDVIFTTAYDDFGIQAIKFSALDYLLKPIQIQELVAAIDKHRSKSGNSVSSEQLQVLFNSIRQDSGQPTKIPLATKESIQFVEPDEIITCSSDSNYTMVYLTDGRKKLVSKTLKDIAEMLKEHHFFRSHHSHLVNINHIKEYKRTEGGYLIMSNDQHVPVARSKKDDLLQLF